MNLLDADRIREPISGVSRERLEDLEVFAEIESTNSYLMRQPGPPPGRFRVVLAEHQTDGRGRMDRKWISPPSSGLCMSMSYTFQSMPDNLPSLTLAVGLGVANALERLGVNGIGLKWPNDLVIRNAKMGGILTEVAPGGGDTVTVVVGVGINVDLQVNARPINIRSRIGHVTDLASCCDDLPSRCVISAAMIEGIFNTLSRFEEEGFAAFIEEWQLYDWLRGQRVSVDLAEGRVSGVCQGIDTDGALIVWTKRGRRRVISGTVHLSGHTGDDT